MTRSEIRHATAPGDITLAYETFGDPADPPVVLIMGLATQMLAWDDAFCELLLGRGLFVARFDNRDVGLSTHLDALPPGDPAALATGDFSSVAYRLEDMAGDLVALLDALGLDRAHLVGASMGGMIAQLAALDHPDRVRSLTSIMSTTGDPSVGGATEAAIGALMAPPATDRDSAVERAITTARAIGSPGFTMDEAGIRDRAGRAYDRAFDPAGASRQLVATGTAADRTERLRALDVPTLVLHGAADPLIAVSGGEATAAAIPGADFLTFDGMGHDIPRALWEPLTARIAEHVLRVEGRG